MFENVDTQKKNDDFEKRITQIYNKYAGVDIAEEYMELWNGFVDLIQYIHCLLYTSQSAFFCADYY